MCSSTSIASSMAGMLLSKTRKTAVLATVPRIETDDGSCTNAAGSAIGVSTTGSNSGATGATSGAGTVCAVVSTWAPVVGSSTRPKSLPPANARTVSPRISIVPASVIPLTGPVIPDGIWACAEPDGRSCLRF